MSQRHRALPRPARFAAFLALSLMVPAGVSATTARADESEVARCIRHAARGNSWLEKTLWGLRDQEGGWIGAAVLNSNGSQDLGPLQVNSWWATRIASLIGRPADHVRHWLRMDACFNAEAARWIFLSALAESRDYWKAIGIYHSPTGWRQRRYAANVAGKLQRRFGPEIFAQPGSASGGAVRTVTLPPAGRGH